MTDREPVAATGPHSIERAIAPETPRAKSVIRGPANERAVEQAAEVRFQEQQHGVHAAALDPLESTRGHREVGGVGLACQEHIARGIQADAVEVVEVPSALSLATKAFCCP
jgi:hypothetical protein